MTRMSFALTTQQVRDRIKTVTRRFGKREYRPGQLVAAVERCMGFKKGEKAPPPICVIEIVSTRWERVGAITDADVAREGFPGRSAAWFVRMLCEHSGKRPDSPANRIEFRYVG